MFYLKCLSVGRVLCTPLKNKYLFKGVLQNIWFEIFGNLLKKTNLTEKWILQRLFLWEVFEVFRASIFLEHFSEVKTKS